jgi:choline dehydrogenase
MGRDSMSVVDDYLKVYGVDNLRIADGSIMPRVTTGNTMAPCVIIGERAAEILRTEHKLHTSRVDEGGKSRSAEIGPLKTPANLERVGACGRRNP